MEIEEAMKVIQALAKGVNPETGGALDGTAICRTQPVVTALQRSLEGLAYLERREKNKRARPGNAGKSWTRAEEEQVCEELRQGSDFNQIAKIHNRSVPSIVARLVKLGKIPANPSGQMFPPKVA